MAVPDLPAGIVYAVTTVHLMVPYLVEHGDAKSLAMVLDRVLDNPSEAKEKVQRGRGPIVDRLPWNAVAERTVAVYREITA